MGKLLTLVLVLDRPARRVLLGMKKRGFGEGKWNGFGGKVEPGESVLECAKRELVEESGLDVPLQSLELRGRLQFQMNSDGMVNSETGEVSSDLDVRVFSCDSTTACAGQTPAESEEMAPRWWEWDKVPFASMWADDPIWFPHLLAGKKFVGSIVFQDKTVLVSHSVEEVPPEEVPAEWATQRRPLDGPAEVAAVPSGQKPEVCAAAPIAMAAASSLTAVYGDSISGNCLKVIAWR
jgi:8-oxo-dGTP diphosphatase/2-hydroxy-dATP diphosphatase